ncbi:MAG: hypothetical protein EBR02_02525 [Alphaproteobacteria bacterium]|nr:hypothetical protein [Alphaproteobacteria bacterium]
MNWGKIFKNAGQMALIMGAVGALLALAMPTLAPVIGVKGGLGLIADTGFQALFFGAFGAISAVVTPVIKAVLGDKAEAEQKKNITVNLTLGAPAQEQAPSMSITNHHTVNNNDVDVVAIDASRTKNTGVDASEHIKLVNKLEANVAADPFARPATSVTDAETRRAALLGPAASQAIH